MTRAPRCPKSSYLVSGTHLLGEKRQRRRAPDTVPTWCHIRRQGLREDQGPGATAEAEPWWWVRALQTGGRGAASLLGEGALGHRAMRPERGTVEVGRVAEAEAGTRKFSREDVGEGWGGVSTARR